MAYLPELHRCCECGKDLGTDNGDGICSDCERITDPMMPMVPGYYWAQWRIPADGTHEGELQTPSTKWEIVQVNENSVDWEQDPEADEALSVAVPGVAQTQWRDCFVWGARVCGLEPPKDVKNHEKHAV